MKKIMLASLLMMAGIAAGAQTVVETATLNLADMQAGVKAPAVTATPGGYVAPKAAETTVKVTVNFAYDHENFAPRAVALMTGDDATLFDMQMMDEQADSYTFDIRPGVYQAVAVYENLRTLMKGPVSYVILEDRDLSAGGNLTFDAATATGLVSFSSFNPDGQETRLHKCKLGDDGLELVESGNVYGSNVTTALIYDNSTTFPLLIGLNSDFTLDEPELGIKHIGLANCDAYINRVSDRWSLVQTRVLFAPDKASVYAVYMKARPSADGADVAVSNNPATYYSYSQPVPPEYAGLTFGTLPTLWDRVNSNIAGGATPELKTPEAFISIPPEGLGDNLKPVYQTRVGDVLGSATVSLKPDGPGFYLPSAQLSMLGTTWPVAHGFSLNNSFDSPVGEKSVPGTSSPVIYANVSKEWLDAGTTVPTADAIVSGYLGALRYADIKALGKSIVCGDKEILGDNDNLTDFGTLYRNAGSPRGLMTMTLVDDGYSYGKIAGRTESVTVWDNTRSDDVPPAITFIQTVDADGVVTGGFDRAAGASLRFSAGDFVPSVELDAFGLEGYNLTWYSYSPVTVKAEYSPVWADSFEELPLTGYPDLLVERGWGAFYTAPLDGITCNAPFGWFDLRITVTDAAGNYQQQTLSPAFRIEELAGIDAVGAEPRAAEVTARYTLQGIRTDNPAPGTVCIERLADGTARKRLQ